MRTTRAVLMLTLVPLLSAEATVRQTEINIDTGNLTERACYFDGKRYSEGSQLQDAGGTIRCGVVDGVTENGPLGWLREGEVGQPVIEQRQDENGRVIEIKK